VNVSEELWKARLHFPMGMTFIRNEQLSSVPIPGTTFVRHFKDEAFVCKVETVEIHHGDPEEDKAVLVKVYGTTDTIKEAFTTVDELRDFVTHMSRQGWYCEQAFMWPELRERKNAA